MYFDPPYRPISQTSSFPSYSWGGFDEKDQVRLAALFRELDAKGAKIMLSNSDPRNENTMILSSMICLTDSLSGGFRHGV